MNYFHKLLQCEYLGNKRFHKQCVHNCHNTCFCRGNDTAVDAASADEIALSFPNLDRKVLEALLYCKNVNLIIGDGSAGAPFKSADAVFLRSSAVNLIYKFCTYNLG